MQIALALLITLVSACLLNLGYLLEHSVASKVPPLSLRRPIASVRSLLGNRRWLMGFGAEGCGWLLYVVALALAPLSLVQAVAAGGIGILAVMVSRFTHVPLTAASGSAPGCRSSGLALLGVSLLGAHGEGSVPELSLGRRLARRVRRRGARSPLPARRRDRSRARVGHRRRHPVRRRRRLDEDGRDRRPRERAFFVCLIAFYGAGTAVLQAGFQRGGALTTAGLATLLTNALPIAAGMIVFREPLPGGWVGAVRIVAFAAVIAGAVLLAARTKTAEPREAEDEPGELATSPL